MPTLCIGPTPPNRPPTAAEALHRRTSELEVQVRQLERRRWCLLMVLLLAGANSCVWAPCLELPAPGAGGAYCDRLQPLYPWVSVAACISLFVTLFCVTSLLSVQCALPRLRDQRLEAARLLDAVYANYGTASLLEGVCSAAQCEDVAGARLLAELAVQHWWNPDHPLIGGGALGHARVQGQTPAAVTTDPPATQQDGHKHGLPAVLVP